MRLWTLHPKYLDPAGLVALWREGLLAQAVLKGRTRGYTRHPQLIRFRKSPSPIKSITCYLQVVHAESVRRGYNFNPAKIHSFGRDKARPSKRQKQTTPNRLEGYALSWPTIKTISVTRDQLTYEWAHLKKKLQARAPSWFAKIKSVSRPAPHPLFRIIPGKIEEWEIIHHKY